jgi:hypothetical protein
MISLILKPLKKPYKYINLRKTEFVEDMQIEEDKDTKDVEMNVVEEDMAKVKFGQYEKDLEGQVEAVKFIRKIEEQMFQYNISKDERMVLISTIGSIFTEAIYGVQKRLYTGWKDFMDVLLETIKSSDPFNTLMLKATWTNL